jgi:hypothetical protein
MSEKKHTTEEQTQEDIRTVEGEIVEEDIDLDDLIPTMNVCVPEIQQKKELITDESLMGVYDEILGMLRNEHTQTTEYIDNFAEMVINGGDSSTSSKEALVNLVKIRKEIPGEMVKVADLMTRLKMKQPDTYKPYLTANQTNNVMIGDTTAERRMLLDAIKKAKKKK